MEGYLLVLFLGLSLGPPTPEIFSAKALVYNSAKSMIAYVNEYFFQFSNIPLSSIDMNST